MPHQPQSPGQSEDLLDRMTARGHAEFTLLAAVHGITLDTERERLLVELGVVAGACGALAIDREDEDQSR